MRRDSGLNPGTATLNWIACSFSSRETGGAALIGASEPDQSAEALPSAAAWDGTTVNEMSRMHDIPCMPDAKRAEPLGR